MSYHLSKACNDRNKSLQAISIQFVYMLIACNKQAHKPFITDSHIMAERGIFMENKNTTIETITIIDAISSLKAENFSKAPSATLRKSCDNLKNADKLIDKYYSRFVKSITEGTTDTNNLAYRRTIVNTIAEKCAISDHIDDLETRLASACSTKKSKNKETGETITVYVTRAMFKKLAYMSIYDIQNSLHVTLKRESDTIKGESANRAKANKITVSPELIAQFNAAKAENDINKVAELFDAMMNGVA